MQSSLDATRKSARGATIEKSKATELRLVKAINVARKREILNKNVSKKRHNKKMCEFTQKQMLEEAARTEI